MEIPLHWTTYLTNLCFTSFHGRMTKKSVRSEAEWFQFFFRLSLSFLTENRWQMYTICRHPPVFIHPMKSQARGPRILLYLVCTRFLARFVLFHFSSSVYILARMFCFVEISTESEKLRIKIKTFEFSLGWACRARTYSAVKLQSSNASHTIA